MDVRGRAEPFAELQNRCPASLAMSGDGSFPSRPRQFLGTKAVASSGEPPKQ